VGEKEKGRGRGGTGLGDGEEGEKKLGKVLDERLISLSLSLISKLLAARMGGQP
jgi:hypothetical protein